MSPAPRGFPAAGPRRWELPNGLTVLVGEHRAAPVVAVQLWVRVGARHETDAESGLSHFVEHLLFKGTAARGPGVIDATIAGLGGEINAATAQDFTYYHVVVPAGHLSTALDVVADAARHAAFDPGELERERLVVLEEIRRAQDSPTASLWRVLHRHHFPGHPYGRPVLGDPEVIRGVPREAVVGYYRRHYAPSRAAVVVVGDVEPAAALAAVERAFGDWEPGGVPDGAVPEAQPLAAIQRVEEVRPLGQVYLGVAWRGPTVPQADVYAVDVLAAILGRGRASRLHQALKERLGVVASVGASFYAQRAAGTLAVTARTTPARRLEAERALLAEIERLRAAPPEEQELARAVTAVEAGYAFARETAEGVAYAWGLAEVAWTLEFELTYLDRVRTVSAEDVLAAARRYLAPDRFTVAALTPPEGAS